MREIIATSKAPAAVGAYSQAVKYGGLIFVSGQLPINVETGEMSTGSMAEQTTIIMNNMQEIARAGGSDLSRALKLPIFLTDLGGFN